MPGKKNLEKEKRKKRIIAAVNVLFYLGMLVLAIGARGLHERNLPQVTFTTPVMKVFEDGESLSALTALPEKLLEGGRIFLVAEEIVNGEVRTIAREAEIEIGRDLRDGYREIVSGVYTLSKVIVDGREELCDGDEILVKGEWSDNGS